MFLQRIRQCSSLSVCHASRAFSTNSSSWWNNVHLGPPDAILGITVAYNADKHPEKINLGVGAYRDDHGQPYVLPVVRRVERTLLEQYLNHEYGPIDGIPEFRNSSTELAYGDTLSKLHVAATQTISGTGALRLAGQFLERFAENKNIYLPFPTWGNHTPIFKDAGLDVHHYAYYDSKSLSLDCDAMIADIKKMPAGGIILLHAAAHNPTGIDPSTEQWKELSKVIKDQGLFVLFDCAYQGFASGNTEKDVESVKIFLNDGHRIMLCQSFAKNFGLYGQRVGCLSLVTSDEDELERVQSQLKILIRPMYSNPPIFGARIVSSILNDAELSAQWRVELKGMADRINTMRTSLRDELVAAGSTRNWDHVVNQIGMFCYSGLTPGQCDELRNQYSVYLTRDGRISMAGVTSKNVSRLAQCIKAVTEK